VRVTGRGSSGYGSGRHIWDPSQTRTLKVGQAGNPVPVTVSLQSGDSVQLPSLQLHPRHSFSLTGSKLIKTITDATATAISQRLRALIAWSACWHGLIFHFYIHTHSPQNLLVTTRQRELRYHYSSIPDASPPTCLHSVRSPDRCWQLC